MLGGLDKWDLGKHMDFIASHGFNAIRIPFSLEFALDNLDLPAKVWHILGLVLI